MKIIVLALISILFISGKAFSDDEPKDSNYVLGNTSWSDWQQKAGWEIYFSPDYHPDTQKAKEIASITNNKNISYIIFAGSWCSDSKSELPKIEMLFNTAGLPESKYPLYGVDRNKREPSNTADAWKVTKVPTLLILQDGKEIGRVLEYPDPYKTWEDKILSIIK